jgi:hypothetical protein
MEIGAITAVVPSGSNPMSGGTAMPHGRVDILHLSGVSLNGGSLPVTTMDGLHLEAYVGNVIVNPATMTASFSNLYTNKEASLITAVMMQDDSGFSSYPCVDPVIVADIDGLGYLSHDDVVQVIEASTNGPTANLPNPLVPSPIYIDFTTFSNIE